MLEIEKFLKELESEFGVIFSRIKEELGMIRSNRPSVEFLENIKVNVYDQWMTIQQLGALGVQPPRDILITAWDKNAVGAIMKAIEDAKIGLSVSNDGNVIRASLPVLTEERKQELAKLVKKISENYRIQVRARRDEAMKKAKAAEDSGEVNEDQEFKLKEKIQKQVDEANRKIEEAVGKKLAELAG